MRQSGVGYGLIPVAACFSLILLGFPLPASAGFLSPDDGARYRDAFGALRAGKGQEALRIASSASDRTLYDIVAGLSLAQADNPYDFAVSWEFLQTHVNWPESERKEIAAAAERRIKADESAETLLAFFAVYPAQTGDGFIQHMRALQQSGRGKEVAGLVRERWRTAPMGKDEQAAFLRNFSRHITRADTFARLDNFLWRNQQDQAEQLYPRLSAGERALAKARLALASGNRKAPRLVNQVPKNLADDPGLLFERARWRRVKSNDSAGALALLKRARVERTSMPGRWWSERGNTARELLARDRAQEAYRLASTHGVLEGSDYADAEFLSGWIALRYLDQPAAAFRHFQNLTQKVQSPISLARGAYWSGRALEAEGKNDEAAGWYQRSVSYGTTFYGQLAASKLNARNRISSNAPPLPSGMAERFAADPPARTVAQLAEAGEPRMASDFALAFVAGSRNDLFYRLMADFVMGLGLNDLAVKISKAAAKENVYLVGEGYPVLEGISPDIAPLAHALIRQESQFDPNAVSTSNAQGLMQLLPSTARWLNKKNGMGLNMRDLCDPDTNIQLGTTYISEMLDNFSGYLPLAIASYNAGPGRVRQWVEKMGDPRGRGAEEVIDWLEAIPYDETRNYVQRVLEALQIYRAKFAGGVTMLALNEDLAGIRVAQND